MIFVKQPSDLVGGGSRPLGPLRPLGPPRPSRPSWYFGLPMVNLGKPPLPPNRPYRQPLNYPEYVITYVRVFKATIKANGEIKDVEIVNHFSFTFKDIMFGWCNNSMGDYPNCIFAKLQLTFCKWFKTIQNDEQVYL